MVMWTSCHTLMSLFYLCFSLASNLEFRKCLFLATLPPKSIYISIYQIHASYQVSTETWICRYLNIQMYAQHQFCWSFFHPNTQTYRSYKLQCLMILTKRKKYLMHTRGEIPQFSCGYFQFFWSSFIFSTRVARHNLKSSKTT